jgi:hypothetical protein
MASSGSFVFGLHAFDSNVRVECFNSEVRDALDRCIFPPIPRSETLPDSPEIDIRLDQGVHGIDIVLNHQRDGSAKTVGDAVLATIKALDDAVVQRLKTLRAVHAGAVLVEGRALLLPGSTHAGKSSLVAELLRRGASCFSDEYALIDGSGRIHPYPRPLLVRDGRPQQTLVLPEELNSKYAIAPASIGWIFAVEFVSGGEWHVRQMPQSEAVMLLLRNTPHEAGQSPQLLEMFLKVASGTICFSGRRGEAAQAAEKILQLVTASPSSLD